MAAETFSYSGNPATDNKDWVRTLLADTNADGLGWLLSDEQILWSLQTEGGPYLAAAACADYINAAFTGPGRAVAQKKVGDLAVVYASGRGVATWAMIAKQLRQRAARGGMPFAGGIDVEDRLLELEDNTLMTPAFERGMDDNPYLPAQPGAGEVFGFSNESGDTGQVA